MLGYDSETQENKMMFLDDLIEYIESPDFTTQHSNDRLFTHYYNGLMQLVQTTWGADVFLLRHFSEKPDERSVERLVARIEEWQDKLRFQREFVAKWGTIISATLSATVGALSGAGFIAEGNPYWYACILAGGCAALKSNIFQY